MPTPPDPTGRPSSAKFAAPVPASNERPADTPPPAPNNPIPLPPTGGSTGSHRPEKPLSDLIHPGSSVQRSSAESDIAQFLAHPQGGAANTDDAPTVITKNGAAVPQTPATVIPLPVNGEPPSIAGRRLGHFELIEAIGAGGMAAVLKARDLELGRIVALKILPPEAARDPESVNRFKQEARAAAKLDHDNVARVYFCGEDQGLHFIAFEFVEGDNLRVLIDRRGPLTAAECVPYMMQVAAGLNHAAERGVVHRDIKPSNILITPDGRAKIVDMGLARYLGSEAVNGGVTQSGVTLGTFDYISPEQALDPRRADVRSDIYSLGCTFYHALTGRPPVPEGTAARKLRAHQNDEPLDPRELNPAIPDELAAILAHMMAKVPADRYQTPTDLIAHLKGLAERLKLRTDPLAHDSATRSVPAELRLLPEAPRVRPWWVLAIAAIALAVVAFVVATSNPGPAPGPPGPDQTAKSKTPDVPFDQKGPLPDTNRVPTGTVTTVPELVKRLADPRTTKVQVQLAPVTFDLSKEPQAVVFRGPELELLGAPGGGTKLILTASHTPGAPGSLTLDAGTVAVRNIWFDLKADPDITDADGPNLALVGLRLDEAREVSLTDCVFAATDEKLKSHAPRSVVVTRPAANPDAQPRERFDVRGCLFAPSAGAGLVAPAGMPVHLTDCGFAPHAAAVLVEAPAGDRRPPEVRGPDRPLFVHARPRRRGGRDRDAGQPAGDRERQPVRPGQRAAAASEPLRVRGGPPRGRDPRPRREARRRATVRAPGPHQRLLSRRSARHAERNTHLRGVQGAGSGRGRQEPRRPQATAVGRPRAARHGRCGGEPVEELPAASGSRPGRIHHRQEAAAAGRRVPRPRQRPAGVRRHRRLAAGAPAHGRGAAEGVVPQRGRRGHLTGGGAEPQRAARRRAPGRCDPHSPHRRAPPRHDRTEVRRSSRATANFG